MQAMCRDAGMKEASSIHCNYFKQERYKDARNRSGGSTRRNAENFNGRFLSSAQIDCDDRGLRRLKNSTAGVEQIYTFSVGSQRQAFSEHTNKMFVIASRRETISLPDAQTNIV